MLTVNRKKSLTLPTRSVFFDPSKDRVKNTFVSPHSYRFKQDRQEGYEARLYWQYEYCKSLGCKTFFYTLTYNDANVPIKYGMSCFDYEDLRDLFTGGFRKKLLRKYGLTFKYFVAAELGDGKGSRGFHNNPHYHVLFFLEPANVSGEFVDITPKEFRSLVRLYWQGFDQELGFKDFKIDCKYGIVKEGEHCGEVLGFQALFYCAKYCCKDIKFVRKELDIPRLLKLNYRRFFLEDLSFHHDFFQEIIVDRFNPVVGLDKHYYTDSELLSFLLPDLSSFFDNLYPNYDKDEFFLNDKVFVATIKLVCKKHNLWRDYYGYLSKKVDAKIHDAVTEWRNRYSNKVRISHGVGDYALEHIDVDNPLIKVPSKNGYKYRNLSMYYYRKLFTGIVKPNEVTFNNRSYKANPVRVINAAGIDYKVSQLPDKIHKMSFRANNALSDVFNNSDLYSLMYNSDVNTDVTIVFDEFKNRLQSVFDEGNKDDLIYKYSIYKLVYENRFFLFDDESFPNIDVIEDYRRFLFPSVFSVPRSDLRVEIFLKDSGNYLSYDFHPFFLRYLSIFQVIDLYFDYTFVCSDDEKQKKAEELADIRRFHKISSLYEKH